VLPDVKEAAETTEAPLPASLRDTDVDGNLRVDEDGNLIVAPDVLKFFDYFFSATGEESPEAIKARIVAAIRKRLPDERAQKQAIALLDKYIAYREGSRSLRPDGDDLASRLDVVKRLRREHFGEGDAEKLFGEQEQADAVAIGQKKVLDDKSLSVEERDKRLAELEKQLPESVRAAREASMRPTYDREAEASMRAEGASDDEIRRFREERWGEEAAGRLADLDKQRAEWNKRLEAFRQKRAELEASISDPARRDAAVQKLLEESFTPQEQIRVSALDKMNAESP